MMAEKKIILIVDDIASNIQTLAAILKDEYQIKVATDGARALEIANQEPLPDLILLDVEMPNMNGYDVIKSLKNTELTKDIPVIFVTANDKAEDEEKGLLLGAVDYITKPVRPAIAKIRIKTQILLKTRLEELLHIALHDKLTGLYNRHYLEEIGDMKFSAAKRHGENLSVIMCDIDHFKAVNDTYGHLCGDKVIQAMGVLLKDHRNEDFAARYGGEEFVVVLWKCSADAARIKAEEFRKSVASLEIEGIRISASFGVTQINTKHKNFEAILKDADDALYRAKENGRNRVEVI